MLKKDYHGNLQITHENRMGYIGICQCCGEVQFCLGNIVSFMPKCAFIKLYRSFQKLNDELDKRFLLMPNGKKVTVRTPVDNLLLSFSKSEFLQVMELFDKMVGHIRLSEALKRVEYQN